MLVKNTNMGKDYVGRFTKELDEVTSKENLMKLRIKKIIGWVVFGLLVGGTIAQELCATPTRARMEMNWVQISIGYQEEKLQVGYSKLQ